MFPGRHQTVDTCDALEMLSNRRRIPAGRVQHIDASRADRNYGIVSELKPLRPGARHLSADSSSGAGPM